MWRSSALRSTSGAKLKATGMPTWCSAAMAAGTSLARLIASMRDSSGAIGLLPSASTAASSRPLAQKSPSRFCTSFCGVCIAACSSSRCWCLLRSASWPSTLMASLPGGNGLAASQAAFAWAWKSVHCGGTTGAAGARLRCASACGAARRADRPKARARTSGRGVGVICTDGLERWPECSVPARGQGASPREVDGMRLRGSGVAAADRSGTGRRRARARKKGARHCRAPCHASIPAGLTRSRPGHRPGGPWANPLRT